jgi:hypothetical protein
LKILLDESVTARVDTFSLSSEVEDLRGELDDLQRQHDEALHEISNNNLEVNNLLWYLKICPFQNEIIISACKLSKNIIRK